jgi:hypothetical protein
MPLFGGVWLADQTECRHIRMLDIQADLFLRLLQALDGEQRIQTLGLPAEVQCVGLSIGPDPRTVRLYLESPEFSEVPVGAIPPWLTITFTVKLPNAVDNST